MFTKKHFLSEKKAKKLKLLDSLRKLHMFIALFVIHILNFKI